MLLQYVSKYVSKFSDASYDEWMNDKASADSVARRVCFEYHPYEPGKCVGRSSGSTM